jgi:polysaccharide deacetylase
VAIASTAVATSAQTGVTLLDYMARACLAVLAVTACHHDIGDLDGVFYDGDGRTVHCAVDLDTAARNTIESIDTGLDRAAERGEVVELYAHDPGGTVRVSTIGHVLEGAQARGLRFVTYRDFADGGGTGPGIALSFDDNHVDDWAALRPLFQDYGARVTFFITKFDRLDAEQRAQLHALAGDGHDIEAHSVQHLKAPEYVEQRGLHAYLADEVVPSIDVLAAEGFDVRAYAYPFGSRTDELDDAILQLVPIVRSVSFAYTGVVESPCPR